MTPTALSLGTWLTLGSPAVAELAGLAGFAWVLIDLEHGGATDAAVPDQLRALRGSPARAIVRVGAPHPELIARLLDWGAHGIMVPHVESAAEAERIVQAAHYAPRGRRGMARTVRAYDYGMRVPDPDQVRPILMAQIETVEAVARVDEIARVDGIDVLFVGPADLQHAIKAHGSGDYARCLDAVVQAAQSAGKSAGILLREPSEVAAYRARGFTCIAIDSDLAILRKAYQQILQPTP